MYDHFKEWVFEVMHNEYTYGSVQGKKNSDEDQWVWINGGWKVLMTGLKWQNGYFSPEKTEKPGFIPELSRIINVSLSPFSGLNKTIWVMPVEKSIEEVTDIPG